MTDGPRYLPLALSVQADLWTTVAYHLRLHLQTVVGLTIVDPHPQSRIDLELARMKDVGQLLHLQVIELLDPLMTGVHLSLRVLHCLMNRLDQARRVDLRLSLQSKQV